jgi:uncharacterized membrane protein YgaE (UPF0421/DUF939 family)
MTNKKPLQKIPQGILHTEEESKQTTRGREVSNYRRRKDKESESNSKSAAHNQTLKVQKQLNGRNNHIPININTECQWTQLSHQKTLFGKLDEKGRCNNLLFPGDPSH